jgi:hypothetical protein
LTPAAADSWAPNARRAGAKLLRSRRRVELSLPKARGDWPAELARPRELLLPPPVEWGPLPGWAAGEAGAKTMDLAWMFPFSAVTHFVSRDQSDLDYISRSGVI